MSKRILMVDDDRRTVELTADLLKDARPSWQVEIVSTDATEGLRRSISENWDLLIWDIWMPPGTEIKQPAIEDDQYGMTSGLEAIVRIRQSLGNSCPPIIALTVLGDPQVAATSHIPFTLKEIGVTCLIKPIAFDDLMEACDKAVDTESAS